MALSRRKTENDEPLTPDQALARIEAFCAYRERSPQEVRQKLDTFGLETADRDQILNLLLDEGWYEENRYARLFASGKLRINHWGKIRIRAELQLAGVRPEAVRAAIAAIDAEEYADILKKLALKKLETMPDGPAPQRIAKCAAYLIGKGFEPELVFDAVKSSVKEA